MLDECIVDHIINMQFESPRHGYFSLTGKIDEVSNHLINIRFGALSLHRDPVTVIRLYRFLLDVGAPALALISHADLLKGKISVIKLVSDEDRRIEGDGHINELKRTIRHELKHKAL